MGVVGEAGVGKRRLCVEFLDRCRARGIAVYEGHCVSHGDALPFLPVLQIFRGFFGIRETDAAADARRRIAGTLLLLAERFREALPLIFDFLGVPDPGRPLPRMDPETRQRQLLAFTSELIRARTNRAPRAPRFCVIRPGDSPTNCLFVVHALALNADRTAHSAPPM